MRTRPVLLARLLWEFLGSDFYRKLSSYFGSHCVDWSTMVNIVRVAEKGGGHTHMSVADVGNFGIYHLGYLLSHILPRPSVSINSMGFLRATMGSSYFARMALSTHDASSPSKRHDGQ